MYVLSAMFNYILWLIKEIKIGKSGGACLKHVKITKKIINLNKLLI